jgi:formyl-CoA transferase
MLESSLVAMGWAVSNWLIAGVRPAPMGNENMTASPSGTFKTGKGLLNIAANKQEQFETLCKLIGREDVIAHPNYAGREDRKRNRFALNAELETALAKKSAAEWSVERKLLQTFDAAPGVDRAVRVVRSGFRLKSGDPEVSTPPPILGADTKDLLSELGYSNENIEALAREEAI